VATPSSKIILSADSTCDLGQALKERHDVHYFHLHIILEEKDYVDSVDITPEQVFAAYRERKVLPKTAAVNVAEYLEYFQQWSGQGQEVIHISLGSGISASHQNALLAAAQCGNVLVIDSGNLSTGSGLLVLRAAKLIAEGMSAEQIVAKVEAARSQVHASFVLDTLEFLRAGGRCTALDAVSASMLKIKPCIEVNNADGTMHPGHKYRGSLDKALLRYVQDKLAQYGEQLDDSCVFITHAAMPAPAIEAVRDYLRQNSPFQEIHVTTASCTISSHCGPGTLGVLFMTKGDS